MSRKKRKNYTPEEKVSILRRHLLDKVPVSDLCDELNLKPAVFYRWQKQFFERGAAAFTTVKDRKLKKEQKKVKKLEEKLAKKNEVVSELMEEHIKLKKELGEI